MQVLSVDSANELFRRYYSTLAYFKQALISVGKFVNFRAFPSRGFFYKLKFFNPSLPRSIINCGILGLKNRTEFLAKQGNISLNEAFGIVNIYNASKHILVCHWDLLFSGNNVTIKCPNDMIVLTLSEPVSNVFSLKISRVDFSKYEVSVVKQVSDAPIVA